MTEVYIVVSDWRIGTYTIPTRHHVVHTGRSKRGAGYECIYNTITGFREVTTLELLTHTTFTEHRAAAQLVDPATVPEAVRIS